MWRWWLKRTKSPELHQRYDKQPEPKCKRAKFVSRVNLYWYTKEQALSTERYLFKAKRNQHIVRDENWRVCNKCKKYKPRSEYARNKSWFHKKCWKCKECANAEHHEYRLNWWYAKDREYKIRKRKLNIWEQVYFNWEIREVVWYKYNRWYTVKSIVSGEERRIDTNDNPIRTNTNCVRFQKLVERVQFVVEEEKEEEKPKFELSLDPDEDDEEYYY